MIHIIYNVGTTYITSDGKTHVILPHTMFQTCMEVLGSSMLVLLLLDFCRLYCGIELHISGIGYYLYTGIK